MGFDFKKLFGKEKEKKKQKQSTLYPKSTPILTEEEVAELIINEDKIERLIANSNHYLRVSHILIVSCLFKTIDPSFIYIYHKIR